MCAQFRQGFLQAKVDLQCQQLLCHRTGTDIQVCTHHWRRSTPGHVWTPRLFTNNNGSKSQTMMAQLWYIYGHGGCAHTHGYNDTRIVTLLHSVMQTSRHTRGCGRTCVSTSPCHPQTHSSLLQDCCPRQPLCVVGLCTAHNKEGQCPWWKTSVGSTTHTLLCLQAFGVLHTLLPSVTSPGCATQ
jgi:hypothetical protein